MAIVRLSRPELLANRFQEFLETTLGNQSYAYEEWKISFYKWLQRFSFQSVFTPSCYQKTWRIKHKNDYIHLPIKCHHFVTEIFGVISRMAVYHVWR